MSTNCQKDNEMFGFLPDGVASPHPDPLGNGTVLLELLGQLGLDTEGLECALKWKKRL